MNIVATTRQVLKLMNLLVRQEVPLLAGKATDEHGELLILLLNSFLISPSQVCSLKCLKMAQTGFLKMQAKKWDCF